MTSVTPMGLATVCFINKNGARSGVCSLGVTVFLQSGLRSRQIWAKHEACQNLTGVRPAGYASYSAPKRTSVPMMATPTIRMVTSVAMLCFDRWVMADESSITPILGPTTAGRCDPSHRNSGRGGKKGLCQLIYGGGSQQIAALASTERVYDT
jgi:hypothetical protein